jgi:hypothetical protein
MGMGPMTGRGRLLRRLQRPGIRASRPRLGRGLAAAGDGVSGGGWASARSVLRCATVAAPAGPWSARSISREENSSISEVRLTCEAGA